MEMTKTITSCKWVVSTVTEEALNDHVKVGVLAPKEDIHWRVPGYEARPTPKEGEVVVFTDHMLH